MEGRRMDITMETAAKVVAGWRRGEDVNSPAGPLYVGGDYAPADISMISEAMGITCSTCTASAGQHCC